MTDTKTSCSTSGCGGKGLCPGIAMLVAYLVGFGLASLTEIPFLGFIVGVPLFVVLVLGIPSKPVAKPACVRVDPK